MNRIYKVIYSKAHQCYIVVSELAKRNHKSSQPSIDHSTPALARIIALALTAGALTWGSTPGISWAADNTAGSGDGVAIGKASNAPKNENVAIGKGAGISYSNGASTATGDIVVGSGANINNYASQGGSIAIGKNAKVENMAGGGEASFAFGQTTFSGTAYSESRIPADPSKVVGSIAIGDNTFARTGSTMIGSHNYKGELGDTTVDSTSTRTYALNVYATTIGANSFSNGALTTNTGSYNIISSNYDGGRLANPVKNMGATITGALNSIESIKGAGYYSGIANTVSGIANRTSNSNGTLIYGAGNEVTNSITSLTGTPTDSGNSAKEFSEKLRDAIKASNSGGATLVIGGANVADYTQKTQIIGVNNKVTETSDKTSDYNMINGYGITVTGASHLYTIGANNTITNAKNTILFGDNRKAEGVENSVIIGNADKETPITTEKKDTVILGHNANATIDGGVAIGSGSIANVDKGQKGYYVKHDQRSEEGQGYPFKNNDSAWISRAGAVSVGDTTNEDQSKWVTRQITGVAAGTKDTDAVNVAQLKNSQTRFYSIYDPGDNWLGIFPQIPNWEKYKNEDNQGAQGYWSMAAGFGTSTGGIASTVIGSLSKIDDKWTDGKPNGFQGATAVSVGTLNLNLSDQVTGNEASSDDPRVIFQSKEESGVANSIVGQGNLTKNSNGALIYGAGNIVTDSYRRVVANGDKDFESLIGQDMESLLSDPEKAIKTLGKIVDISGGKVMAIGGGNVVDKAYDSQVMGVGNTVVGDAVNFEYKESPEVSNLPEGTFDEQVIKEASRDADVWTQYMGSIRKQGTLLNLVDGYYSTLKNGQNDYLIGTANEVTGDPSKNKSNIVFGDYHKLNNGNNNIIIGSADGAVVEKATGYFEDSESGITTSQEITGQKQHTENLEDAVMIGHNADVQKNGGVAIGAGSVAVIDKDQVGYDPANGDHQTDTTGTWKSTAAAVSVGRAEEKDKEGKVTAPAITRQITNVAAGTQDTDAVNVAQLKAISSTMNTDIAASKTHFYSVKSTDAKAKNYNNDGATAANALAAGVGANADKASAVAIGDTAYAGSANGVAIGTGSWIRSSDGKPNANGGDVAIGQDSHVDSYVNQGGSIALGQNARVENMYGNTEKSWALGQTEFDDKNIPLNPGNEAGGVAIGRNSFARTGSLMVGSHMYKGAIADIDEVDGTDSQKLRENFNNINMTTLGTNSFNNGTFATVTGAYSATTAKKKIQNFAATVDGSLNSIESYKDAADNSGVASSIVGTANRIANSNNTTILGAGNEVTNSLTDITAPTEGGASAKALQDTLKGNLQQDTKGAVVVSGIGNTVDSSHGVSVLGSRNVVKTTDNIQLLGDNREVAGANGSVIIGSADSKMTTSVTDATILGHNANVEKAGGVALGAGSVASREASVAGYDPATKTDSTDSSATWKATDAAVSVGKEDGTMTRQITGVAAGTKATDAVNVAQLQKALSGAKDGNDTLKSDAKALTLNGNTLSMNVEDTAGHKVSGSVDLSKFAQAVDTNTTYTLTGEANPDTNTTTITLKDSNGNKNSVTVATKDTDTRNTVKAGENVTLDTKDNSDGSHEYTVNVKADGKVEAGSTKIVSGGTVYNETRVAKDGNFVKQSNTAGENLSALDSQVASNASGITNLTGRVSNLDSKINKVGAGAAALAALHPLDFDPDDKWDFAVGYGNYRDANSAAVGAFYRPDEDTMFSLGTNFGNGENMINAGVSFKFGPKGKSQVRPGSTQEITELRATVARQDDQLKKQDSEIKELKAMVQQLLAAQDKKTATK